MKVASGSEKQALVQLDPSFMSDEEDGVENEAGSWIGRSPSWRSPELTSLVKRLQGKVEAQSGSSHPKNKRLHGEPSSVLKKVRFLIITLLCTLNILTCNISIVQ